MTPKSRFLIALLLIALVACRPDSIDPTYRFEEGETVTYDLEAEAKASWDIGGQGEGSYSISFLVTEAVISADEEKATIDVTMSPVSVEEDGLPSPGPDDRTFTMLVGQNGRVREVLRVDGVAADTLDPNDLAFIGLYRPPLPTERVRIGDRWDAAQDLSVGDLTQDGAGTGRLEGLTVRGSTPIADLSYEISGPVRWDTQLPQGAAELTGSSTTTAHATLELDTGHLSEAHAITTSEFQVRVLPRGGQGPVAGTLRLNLSLALRGI